MIDDIILKIFLRESNAIESEYSEEAYEDAYKAWKFLDHYKEIELSLILEAHRILMKRLNKQIAGKIRKCDVRIGNSLAIPYEEIRSRLNRLLQFTPASEAEIVEWHIQFEYIHPFEDGNGRIGRILYNIQRTKSGLPIHVIYEKNKSEYYELFHK